MANKKKKRPGPPKPRPQSTGPSSPAAQAKREAQAAKREEALRRRQKAKRRRQIKQLSTLGVIVLMLAALLVWQIQRTHAQNEKAAEIAKAAGCGPVRETGTSGGGQHLQQGQGTTYDTKPPTHGAHALAPLSSGVYTEPFSEDPAATIPSIFQAVHSLEHGYIVVWHNGLTEKEADKLGDAFRTENKVIVVPYPKLEKGKKMALTAWGRLQTCTTADPKAVSAFVKLYRESKNAPEPIAQ